MYIDLKEYTRAVEDCENAIKCNPKWTKAYLRKAIACSNMTNEEQNADLTIEALK